ncbi:MAG TPA: LacI family DNA-binding transcriptional regulator [Capsulimonadaceae bacterium]|jgi:LacI family transcriptional regulator
MTNIKKVAEASGVSTATVSYVLNNGPRPVKRETRDRVFAAMRDLNYHPSAIARRMHGKRVNTIGVVALHPIRSVFKDPYFNAVIGGIVDAGAKLGQSVMIFNGDRWLDPDTAVPIFCDGRCDGLLLLVAPLGDRMIPELKMRTTPFVSINEAASDPDVSSVDISSYDGAKMMVRYLIERGHRRIAHFTGDDYYQSANDRFRGYREALADAGIEFDPRLVYQGRYDYESGYDRALENGKAIAQSATALFCANDYVAYGALRGLAANGVCVPGDISIAGIDGVDFGPEHGTKLTTMDQDLEGLADEAVQLLMHLIEDSPLIPIKKIRPLRLREGDTVAAPAR